jgi:hypothetical protein
MKLSNVLILLVGAGEIVLGVFFLMNSVTDIQLGFGAVLLAQGIIHLAK